MAANCPRAGDCSCSCHQCRYGGHACSAPHEGGCHVRCTPPPWRKRRKR